MSEFVKGKNIMITGATSGIGLELVKSFSSKGANIIMLGKDEDCLLYTSPSPRDRQKSRMPSSA